MSTTIWLLSGLHLEPNPQSSFSVAELFGMHRYNVRHERVYGLISLHDAVCVCGVPIADAPGLERSMYSNCLSVAGVLLPAQIFLTR